MTAASTDPRFLIIGAGMLGTLAAIEVRKAGHDDFVIYEKAERRGGTWRDNTYPGIACDVPSHFYSNSFAPGAEIQACFEDVARRFGVLPQIRFGAEVVRCSLENGRWRSELADGSRDEPDFVIAATGVLHHPAIAEIEVERSRPSTASGIGIPSYGVICCSGGAA